MDKGQDEQRQPESNSLMGLTIYTGGTLYSTETSTLNHAEKDVDT
jgi:hypothetical protein